MYIKELRFNFRPLGQEIKRKREEMIGRTSHTVMYMENRGQHPSLNTLYRVITALEIPVDQFFSPKKDETGISERRRIVNSLLDSLSEGELSVIEATAEGLIRSREIDKKQ